MSLLRTKTSISLAGRHHRCLTGTRFVGTAGSHRLDDVLSSRCNRSNKPEHSSLLLGVRAFHASPTHCQSADDFALRAEQFGLASKEEVALAAQDPSAVFLDVRSPPEIEDAPLTSRPCVRIWCTMDDASRLVEQAERLIPDKDATVVIFCAVGGRAMVAKNCLEDLGYKNVINAGGLCDLNHIQ